MIHPVGSPETHHIYPWESPPAPMVRLSENQGIHRIYPGSSRPPPDPTGQEPWGLWYVLTDVFVDIGSVRHKTQGPTTSVHVTRGRRPRPSWRPSSLPGLFQPRVWDPSFPKQRDTGPSSERVHDLVDKESLISVRVTRFVLGSSYYDKNKKF